jgi:hypothetical protein
MDEQPECGEISKAFGLEYLAQVGFNIRWTSQAGVVANQAQRIAVAAQAPESRFAGIEPLLQRRCGGAAATFTLKVSAGAVEIISRGNNNDGNAAGGSFKSDREGAPVMIVMADAVKIRKTEDITQKSFGEVHRSGRRGSRTGKQILKDGLADAEVTCDFVAESEAARNAVVGFRLTGGFVRSKAWGKSDSHSRTRSLVVHHGRNVNSGQLS